jgi:hypothetical protein
MAFCSARMHRQAAVEAPPARQASQPPSPQFLSPAGVSRYPVTTTMRSRTITAPLGRARQVDRLAARPASPRK